MCVIPTNIYLQVISQINIFCGCNIEEIKYNGPNEKTVYRFEGGQWVVYRAVCPSEEALICQTSHEPCEARIAMNNDY